MTLNEILPVLATLSDQDLRALNTSIVAQTISYAQLAAQIANMTQDQKDSPITFFDTNEGEYYALELLYTEQDEDVVEPNSPYFSIKND